MFCIIMHTDVTVSNHHLTIVVAISVVHSASVSSALSATSKGHRLILLYYFVVSSVIKSIK